MGLGQVIGIAGIVEGADGHVRKARADRIFGQLVGSRFRFNEAVMILIHHMHRHVAAADLRQCDGHRLGQVQHRRGVERVLVHADHGLIVRCGGLAQVHELAEGYAHHLHVGADHVIRFGPHEVGYRDRCLAHLGESV
jgi:hypothetical protein